MKTLSADLPSVLLIPGFGDGAEMFAPLEKTDLKRHARLVAIDLPGFAGAPPVHGTTDLATLAEVVYERAEHEDARIVAGHSIASVIASLAARREPRVIDTIISLEGNLTRHDAYFSGMAADFTDPETFKRTFLERVGDMAKTQPILQRYRDIVAKADAKAMWTLGCDARRFSEEHVPGVILRESADVWYLYNSENCDARSLAWLENDPIKRMELKGASHWPSLDQPDLLAKTITSILDPH